MSAPPPSLDHAIATRDPGYKAVLAAVTKCASSPDMGKPILFSGADGIGKLGLARRYDALVRHNGGIAGPLCEVVCSGHPDEDVTSIFGPGRNQPARPPDEVRVGALVAAQYGALILHRVERLTGRALVGLVRYLDNPLKVLISADRPEPVIARLICTSSTHFAETSASMLRALLDARHFAIPSLVQRPKDIEPAVDELLRQHRERLSRPIDFTREARREYIGFCTSKFAVWEDSFRDLQRSVQRLVDGMVNSLIHLRDAEAEVDNLGSLWAGEVPGSVPREKDRKGEMLRKYLARYGLTFEQIKEQQRREKKKR